MIEKKTVVGCLWQREEGRQRHTWIYYNLLMLFRNERFISIRHRATWLRFYDYILFVFSFLTIIHCEWEGCEGCWWENEGTTTTEYKGKRKILIYSSWRGRLINFLCYVNWKRIKKDVPPRMAINIFILTYTFNWFRNWLGFCVIDSCILHYSWEHGW